jgi:5'-nucleotidase
MRKVSSSIASALLLATVLIGCSSGSSTSTSESTSTTAAEKTIEILVTNDDGYDAAGIDAVVEGLRALPGVRVTVVAPATNQSGKGSAVTDGALTVTDGKTKSGHEAKAVAGTPADTIIWAIDQKGISFTPDLVISGINAGANMGPAVELSGTVGAARAAVQRGIPALAASQGPLTAPFDFPAGVKQVITWFEANRAAIADGTMQSTTVSNLNIPTCATGSVRGQKDASLATSTDGYTSAPDCDSTVSDPANDIAAYLVGFAPLTQVSAKPAA